MKTSGIEQYFINRSGHLAQSGRIPSVIVENVPNLGLLAALRFIEWIIENPDGVISLPAGKAAEHFIRWTQRLLINWGKWFPDVLPGGFLSVKQGSSQPFDGFEDAIQNLGSTSKPLLSGLTFVQMNEFYPINPSQHNSLSYYVKKYYISQLGLDIQKALLINSDEIPLSKPANQSYTDIFPELTIDLTLRHREPVNHLEEMQQKAIFNVDSWCMEYEQKIRSLGGIGFFLGGIGPDGHIAFNIKGTDHNSSTRLSPTNYATQASAAGDLGGIEISGSRHVITIGLGTITMNPDAVAIIIAAGENKAPVVTAAIEREPSVLYPASVLQKLPNARFYLTAGASKQLCHVRDKYFSTGSWSVEKSIMTVLNYCQQNNIYAHKIAGEGLKTIIHADYSSLSTLIPKTIEEVKLRLERGMERIENKVILHTGPHHDDIMLGLMPMVNRQLRAAGNQVHFAVATSGFTALSNRYLTERLEHTLRLIDLGQIQMLNYPDFYAKGFLFKWDKDVNHFLNKVGERDEEGKYRGLSHRIIRCMVRIWKLNNKQDLINTITEVLNIMRGSYDGEKNPPQIQQLKGMIREFEEELVWAHSGIQVKDVHHLRLGFYTGEVFTEQPEEERDVKPILDLLNRLNPDIISICMDPEGSGPDTHYKVLQATAKALKTWTHGSKGKSLKIIAYRNVWYRFHAAEANVYVPVSLNSLAVLQNSFRQCYLSQVEASFPSPELKGPFCDLAQKVWVDQFKEIQLLLGKDFFYENSRPLVRAAHGLIFYRELPVIEFLAEANELARRTE